MATARYFIERGLKSLGVQPAESSIESYEMNDGLEVFNDMGAEWVATGLNIGFVPVEKPSDEVNIPRGAYTAFWSNFAIRISPDYADKKPTAALVAMAKASADAMLTAYQKPLNVKYPSTLPTGSGNQCDGDTYFNRRFFPGGRRSNF